MQPALTAEDENKALIRRWFEEVWNRGRTELIDELRAPDAVVTGLREGNAESRGGADFRAFHAELRGAFPDLVVKVEAILAEDDRVAVRITFEGTHLGDIMSVAPTGRRVCFSGISIARIAGGKIVEGWNSLDRLGLLRQIDAFPAAGAR